MDELERFFARVRGSIDGVLNEVIPAADVRPTRLHEAVRWSVFAGGKRIRPAILVAVGETFGASISSLLHTAAAVEMIHAYSLIHDDLPAMDDDDLRRGRATCHKQFGDATAILAGDVLQTLAFKSIAGDANLAADVRIRLVSLIAEASGTPNGMVSGQQLDLDSEGSNLAIDEIEQIHRQKTGALIAASAVAGAIIGEASEDELAAIRDYGEKLGLLFQITDDLLDVTQETGEIGKTAGKDAAAKKATYPGHYGIDATVEMAGEIRDQACAALLPIEKNIELLLSITGMILNRTR